MSTDGYDPDRLTRPQVLAALVENGWGAARLDDQIGRHFPRGVRRCPLRDNAYENALNDLETVPSLFARFTDQRLIQHYLRPAAEDQVKDILSAIEEYTRSLRHGYPAVRRYEQDITQQVAAVLCGMTDDQAYDPAKSTNFWGWLYWVTRNQARQYIRHEAACSPAVDLAGVGEPAAPDQAGAGVDWEHLVRQIDSASGPSDAEVFRLRSQNNMSVPDIAVAQGRTEAAIYKQLSRLEDKMRGLGILYFRPLPED